MDGDSRRLYLATWERRFGAWLIDVVLVSAIVGVAGSVVGPLPGVPSVTGIGYLVDFGAFGGLGLFVYWTALEGNGGQSAGKIALDLRVVDRAGDEIGYVTAAIEAFGKAFLLPLDCLIGWLAMPGEQLRLFNRLSNTIVVETEGDDDRPADVEYVYPDE